MSCRDEGLCYGGLWLMFTACEPLRAKVEAMEEFPNLVIEIDLIQVEKGIPLSRLL